jgi:hypothetical protein
VQIINKEHGAGGRGADVKIRPQDFVPKSAAAMFLAARDGDVEATNNVTLGGSTIANNAAWAGKWTTLGTSKEGCSLTVPAASAAIVRLWR